MSRVRTSFLAALLDQPDLGRVLINSRTGAPLATRVETAFDRNRRRRGLLGRDRLDEGSAMVLAPCNSVHTFFMRFPIDIVFVATDGRAIKLRHACLPWRLAAAFSAFATIELPAGVLRRAGVEVGDRIQLSRPE